MRKAQAMAEITQEPRGGAAETISFSLTTEFRQLQSNIDGRQTRSKPRAIRYFTYGENSITRSFAIWHGNRVLSN
jgi:hypothetical protein